MWKVTAALSVLPTFPLLHREPRTFFQLLKWMHNRENHFNLLEMAPAKVNHTEMMEMLINLLSSWSDSVFNLKA